MARTHIRQDTQVASTNQTVEGYDDSKTLGAVLETGAASLLDDLNALRSVLAYIRDLQVGSWRDPLSDPTANGDTGAARGVQGLNTGIYALERARFLVLRNLLFPVTVPGSANVSVLGAGELPTQTQIGVGTTDTLGTVAAEHTGTFGDHSLDVVTGVHVLAPKNLLVITASTGAPILSGGRQVWGLLQSENATDGHTATENTPDRLQISFVRPTVGFDGLEVVPTADIQNKAFRYGYAERLALQQMLEQDLFPTEASQTAGTGSGGGGGDQTLSEVINAAIPANDVTVPVAAPVIFRDGGESINALHLVQTNTDLFPNSNPALRVTVPSLLDSGTIVESAADPGFGVSVTARSVIFETPDNQPSKPFTSFGPRSRGAGGGHGADCWLIGGSASDPGSLCGDLVMYAGASFTGATQGKIRINPFFNQVIELGNAQGEVNFANGLTITERADHPVAATSGKGQVWIKSTDKRLYFTDEDGRDIDLTDDPKTAVITRDGNDRVLTVAAVGEATWTISRNVEQRVSSLNNGIYNVTVSRDGNGRVTGVTSVKL